MKKINSRYLRITIVGLLCMLTLVGLVYSLVQVPAVAQEPASPTFDFGRLNPQRPRAPSLPVQNLTNDVILPPSRKTLLGACGTTLVCPATFASMHSYVPTSLMPNKNFRVNFVVVQKGDGSGNWTNSSNDIAALNQLVSWMNNYFYQSVCVPSDPCPGVVYPSDTKIRIKLQNIYFLQSNTLYSSSNVNSLLAAVVAAHPDARQQLNIFWTGGSYGGASAIALTPSDDRSYDQAVVLFVNSSSDGSGSYLQYAMAGTLVHELGHIFGLLHTYSGCCSPETATDSCNYLDDVFCPPTNPYPQTDTWACDPTLPSAINSCTNNMMGGVRDACLFSPLQLGRMHREMSTTSANKYVEPTVCLPPPAGMTLWLPFDEPYGTTALNPPGTAGTQVGNPTRISGKANRALQFNGTSDYVDVPNYAGVNFGTKNFTLEAWIMPTGSAAAVQVIAEKRAQQGGSYYGYSFFLYNGRPSLQMADGAYANFLAPNVVPNDGNWHHVAVVVSRHAALGGVFYVDGLPVSTFDPRPRNQSLDNTMMFRVGSDTVSTSSFFKGGIDEVVAYTRALSATEIQAIFAAQGVGRCKQNCSTPNVRFNQNQPAVTINGQICNATAVPRAFMYWYESTPAATCTASDPIDGPPTFASCSGFITLPAGTCMAVPTSVSRPPGFNNAGNSICYRLAIQSLGNDDVANIRCEAVLADYSVSP